MNIYEYNSSTINEYSSDDCGLITSSSIEVFDCGKITNELESSEDFSQICYSETLLPFGKITLKSSTETECKKVSSEFNKFENLNKKSLILSKIIVTWYGYGTVFELNNGLERQVIPDVSGGGIIV